MADTTQHLSATHHARLQLWRSPVEHVRRFDTILHYANRSVEEPHKVTRRFPSIVGEHFTVPLPDCNQELVDGHGRVDGDFATKEGLYVMFHDGFWRMFGEECGQSLDAHCRTWWWRSVYVVSDMRVTVYA